MSKKNEQKPIDIVIDETKANIVQTLNESGLSIGVMAMVLRDLSAYVSQQAQAKLQTLRQEKVNDQR